LEGINITDEALWITVDSGEVAAEQILKSVGHCCCFEFVLELILNTLLRMIFFTSKVSLQSGARSHWYCNYCCIIQLYHSFIDV